MKGLNCHIANWDKFREQLAADSGDVISEGSAVE